MTYPTRYLTALLLLLASTTASAQFPTDLATTLANKLETLRLKNNTIGVAAAIISPKYGTWIDGAGYANPLTGDTVVPEMLFGIGSITKTFTSAAILKLVQQRRLELTDTIGKWITGYANINGAVTVRQLLNHTSGLYDYTSNSQFWEYSQSDLNQMITPDDILPFVGPPNFTPGFNWRYCNTGYILLGVIIERVTGHSYESEIESMFLRPLELDAVAMGTRDTLPGVVVDNWENINASPELENMNSMPRRWLYSGAWTAGGLFSNVETIARWGHELYSGNVLSSEMMTHLTQFVPVSSLGANGGYGLGIIRAEASNRLGWGHTGSIPGFHTILWYIPEDSVTIAVFVNDPTYPATTAFELLDAYYAYAPSSVEVASSPITGVYPNPFTTSTRIAIDVTPSQHVELRVYDALGRAVRTLSDDASTSVRSLVWDGRDDAGLNLPAGVYFVRDANGSATSTMVVLTN